MQQTKTTQSAIPEIFFMARLSKVIMQLMAENLQRSYKAPGAYQGKE
jgi:hypothetical protein